jgi:hypothetical protein
VFSHIFTPSTFVGYVARGYFFISRSMQKSRRRKKKHSLYHWRNFLILLKSTWNISKAKLIVKKKHSKAKLLKPIIFVSFESDFTSSMQWEVNLVSESGSTDHLAPLHKLTVIDHWSDQQHKCLRTIFFLALLYLFVVDRHYWCISINWLTYLFIFYI